MAGEMGRAIRSDPTSHYMTVRSLQLNIGALSGQRANLAFRLGPFASLLTVLFQLR